MNRGSLGASTFKMFTSVKSCVLEGCSGVRLSFLRLPGWTAAPWQRAVQRSQCVTSARWLPKDTHTHTHTHTQQQTSHKTCSYTGLLSCTLYFICLQFILLLARPDWQHWKCDISHWRLIRITANSRNLLTFNILTSEGGSIQIFYR